MWLLKLLRHLLLQRKSSERNDPQPWVSSAPGSTWGPLLPTLHRYGSEHRSSYEPTLNESLQVLQKTYYWEEKKDINLNTRHPKRHQCALKPRSSIFWLLQGQNTPKSLVSSKLALHFPSGLTHQTNLYGKENLFLQATITVPFFFLEKLSLPFFWECRESNSELIGTCFPTALLENLNSLKKCYSPPHPGLFLWKEACFHIFVVF